MVLAATSGDHHNDDDHHDRDDADGGDDRPGHGHEAELEGFFRLGEGLGQGVSEQRVDSGRGLSRLVRIAQADDVKTDLVGAARCGLLEGFIEVVPVEEELVLVGVGAGALVDAAQHQFPVAGKDRPLQCDLVTELPAEAFGQLDPGHGTAPVAQKGALLLGRKDEFGIELEVAGGLYGEVGEKVFAVDVNAPEPVAERDLFNPRHLANPFLVGEGQRKYQGDGVAGDQPVGRRGLHPHVPGPDEGAQQTEGKDRHGDADHGQGAAQPVAQGVAQNQPKQEHRRAVPSPGDG